MHGQGGVRGREGGVGAQLAAGCGLGLAGCGQQWGGTGGQTGGSCGAARRGVELGHPWGCGGTFRG